MSARNENAPPVLAGRGAEGADQGISEAHGRTHGRAAVKRLIVGAAVRGLLPAGLASWAIHVLSLRRV